MIVPTRRPLIGLALAFVAGTGTGLNWELPLALLLTATALLTAGASLLCSLPPLTRSRGAAVCATALLLAAAGGLGASNARLHTMRLAAPPLPAPAAATDTVLRGVVDDEPLLTRTRSGRTGYRFPLTVTAVQSPDSGAWHPVSGNVRVTWFGPASALPSYGEAWQWRGRLSAFTPEQRGILTRAPFLTFVVTVGEGRRLSTGNGNPFVAWCLRMRRAACETLTLGIRDFPEQVGILISLVLGYRSQVPADLYQAFAATGTLHVFAVSGSHVVVLAGAMVFVLSACRLPRTRWVLLLGPALIVYTVMTGLQPSAVRACIMGIAYAAAPLFNRRSDLYTALAFAAVSILFVAPADLVNIGFILSFVAVLGIGLFYPVIAGPLHRRIAPDPLQLIPDPLWRRASRTVLHHAVGLLAMSLAAWIATAPLTALYFDLFSPIALLGNLAAVPLASLIVITGLVSLAGGSLAAAIADVFNHANLVLASLLGQSIRLLAAVPGGHLQVSAIPATFIAVWYVVLLVWRFRLWIREAPDAQAPAIPM